MRTMTNVNPKSMYCDFALDALEVYYKAYSEQDIEQFIQNVIHDIDPLKEKRETFYKKRLLPPNGKSPSQNIINDIVNSIKHQRVWTDWIITKNAPLEDFWAIYLFVSKNNLGSNTLWHLWVNKRNVRIVLSDNL